MAKQLILVDYENVTKIDLSLLDNSYRAIVFIGASQNPPKASRKKTTAHRFKRVEFRKISGSGKNALDFHMAFHLGRIFETAADTICTVISRDKGYDPLLHHLNDSGLSCRRVESFDQLLSTPSQGESTDEPVFETEIAVCIKCKTAETIEHHGGRWCARCGSFTEASDPKLLPSRQPDYREPPQQPFSARSAESRRASTALRCSWCHRPSDMADGIYDDGEWMCGDCISNYVS